uniref:Barrier-to-autointegration factor n=1 Tax=Jaculus jaculus TaxID=51337 RepID=A0A8C5K0Y3_JACJA
KARDFLAEPMGEKPAGSLAGIGEVLGKKLEERGSDKAYVVPGQFLVLKEDKDLFREWLKDTCGANAKQSCDCFGCLREWCDAFLLCSLRIPQFLSPGMRVCKEWGSSLFSTENKIAFVTHL